MTWGKALEGMEGGNLDRALSFSLSPFFSSSIAPIDCVIATKSLGFASRKECRFEFVCTDPKLTHRRPRDDR